MFCMSALYSNAIIAMYITQRTETTGAYDVPTVLCVIHFLV